VILAGALALALLPGRAAAQTGGISGAVTDAGTGTGLSATVSVYNWHGSQVASTGTGVGGAYSVTGLTPGIYFARTFVSSTLNYVDEAYNNVQCVSCPITTTQPITVSGGATTVNVNFALSPGGSIAGAVTDGVTSAAIANATVQVYVALSPTNGSFLKSVLTNAAGAYTLSGLTPGSYFVVVFPPSPYLPEGYDNVPCSSGSSVCTFSSFTQIPVSGTATTSNINFALSTTASSPGGISGTVTDASTALPLANVEVDVYNSTGGFVGFAITNAAGTYAVTGLAAGTYYARTFVFSTANYLTEAYNDIPCTPSCNITSTTPIAVGIATVPNINFALSPGGGITGTVTDGEGAGNLQSVTVQIYTSTGSFIKSASTDAAGVYLVVGLPPGNYFARTFVPSSLNNLDEAYNNFPCTPSCTITSTTPITVAGTGTTAGISFVLPHGGTITGNVTDVRTGAPGRFINVQIFSSTGASVKSVSSNTSGVYSVAGLPTGTYFARTGTSATYVSELYNNITCPHNACVVTTGAPISVTTNATQGGINFQLGPAGAADLVMDFGAANGVWVLAADGTWTKIHSLSPVASVTADLDGSGRDDLVVNFGPGIGVWAWMNHATWVFVHAQSPTQMVVGDLDDNGREEVLFAFTGLGIWRWSDNNWFQVHGLNPNRMAVGRVDAIAGDDVVIDFPGLGIWVLYNNSSWVQLHTLNASAIVTADLNGNGRDEVVFIFPGLGVWAYRDTGAWVQLHGLNPVRIAVGHLDTSTREDLVIDFGGLGVWTYRNDVTWTQLHVLTTEGIWVVDRNASLSDEIILDFGPAWGLWQFNSSSVWSQLHTLSPEDLVAGRYR
jgi:hypothetical protein